ncbi:MAG: hypothetical protein ACRDYY_14745 [Acidimicrobiales bacterium]
MPYRRWGCAGTAAAPRVDVAVERLAAEHDVAIERRPYRPGEAAGYRLVIAAPGVPEVDAAVATDAGAAGV